VNVNFGMHTMPANHSMAFPVDTARKPEPMADAQPWVGAEEPMLPARQVLWVSLALIAVSLVVLWAA
jgi:hypothetical protein